MSHYFLDACLVVTKAVSNKCVGDIYTWNIMGRFKIRVIDLDHRNTYASIWAIDIGDVWEENSIV